MRRFSFMRLVRILMVLSMVFVLVIDAASAGCFIRRLRRTCYTPCFRVCNPCCVPVSCCPPVDCCPEPCEKPCEKSDGDQADQDDVVPESEEPKVDHSAGPMEETVESSPLEEVDPVPVEEETTPAVEEETTPAVEEETTPAVEEDTTPAVEEEATEIPAETTDDVDDLDSIFEDLPAEETTSPAVEPAVEPAAETADPAETDATAADIFEIDAPADDTTDAADDATDDLDIFDNTNTDTPADDDGTRVAEDTQPDLFTEDESADNATDDASDLDNLFDEDTDADTTEEGDLNNLFDEGADNKPPTKNRIVSIQEVDKKESEELPFRLWIDNTGNYKTIGRLVEVTDTHVRLFKDNGRFSTVSKQRLSHGDLRYAEKRAKSLTPINVIAQR